MTEKPRARFDLWPLGDGTVRFSMTFSGIRDWEGGGGHIMLLISDWLPVTAAGQWLVRSERTVTTRDLDSWSSVSMYTMSRSETILPLMTRISSPTLSTARRKILLLKYTQCWRHKGNKNKLKSNNGNMILHM